MFTEIAKGIRAIGVADSDLDLFENQYPLVEGVTYNSYIISDGGMTAVIDAADSRRGNLWLENVASATDKVDYLVVLHMEPDHSYMIEQFASRYPDAKIVASAQALRIIGQFFPKLDLSGRTMAVKEGDTLAIGTHTLTFFTAPMVHWPEVMVAYDLPTGTLFTADAFGTFGTSASPADLWPDEARRYYANIVGKYGPQVQKLLSKVEKCENVARAASLHGPVLKGEQLQNAISLYKQWSTYTPELPDGVLVAYASIYGNTASTALEIARQLQMRGLTVATIDLCRHDVSYAVAQAFRMGKIVVAAASYDGGVFPPMHHFLYHLQIKGLCNRTFAIVENGSWAPSAARSMHAMIEAMKNCTILPEQITIKSAPDDSTAKAIEELVAKISI